MKCEDIRKNLDLYIDAEILSDEEREEIRTHLDDCEACHREYEEMKKIQSELEKLADIELPKDFHKNLMKEIRKTDAKKEAFFKRHYRWSMGVAAVLIVGVMTTAGINLIPRLSMGRGQTAMDSASVEYGAPEEPNTKAAFTNDVQLTFNESVGMADEAEEAQSAEPSPVALDGTVERKIVKNVYIELDTEAIEETFERIQQHVDGIGGYVEYSNIGDIFYQYYEKTQSQEQMRNASINARVPAEQLDAVIAYVESQGEIRNKTFNTSDQSDYYYDIDSQVQNLKAREDRLRSLMDEAEDISDIIEIERELSRVRNEIDQLTRNLRYIDKDVDYSRVNIQLREVMSSSKIAPEDRNIWTEAKEGLIKNVNRLINFLQNAMIWSISYLPILIAGLVGLGVLYWLIRKLGRIRNKKL